MIFALITGTFLLTAAGSEDDQTSSGPLYKNKFAIEATFGALIKKQLRDPDSYEFISCEPLGDELKDGRFFTIKYRAKNGFGGYAIGTAVVTCDTTTMTLVSNECN